MYTREEAVCRMNTMGRAGNPFFFVISYDREHCLVFEAGACDRRILVRFPSGNGIHPEQAVPLPQRVFFEPHPCSAEEYDRAFEIVSAHLKRGDSYLLNLCVETPIASNLSVEMLFSHAQAPYKLYLGDDPFAPSPFDRSCACFSPEPFVRIQDGVISCYPMKGTAKGEENEARRWLETDEKENRESATIVDLMRNDLAMVAKNIHVRRYRFISPVITQSGTIWQCSSEIVGTLDENWQGRIGDILMKLLPAGSISGAPKEATCRAIAEAETMERGFYTGIFGYFDGIKLDSAVIIRFVEEVGPEKLVYKSGGGITVMSRAEEEYQEVLAKVYVPFDV